MQAAIYVGVSEKTVQEVTKSILDVIATPAGDAVKIAAIDALTKALNVSNNSISNVHVEMPTHNYPNNDDVASTTESDEEQDNLDEEEDY
jgi:hypothetical protein